MTHAPAHPHSVDLTEGNIAKNILIFALPLVAGQLFQNLYNTVDSIVVSRCVGLTALAAVTSCTDISRLLVGFFTGLSVGSGVAFSRYFGSKDYDNLHRAIHTALAFSVLMGLGMMALGILSSPLLLRVVDCPADVYPEALLYLRVYLVGVLFTSIYNVQSGVLRSVGDSRSPFLYLVAASFINIALDLFFVAGLGWGVAGVAIATILSQSGSVAMVTVRMLRTTDVYHLNPRHLTIDGKMLSGILKLGIPSAIQTCLISFSNLFVQRYVNSFGTQAMAGAGAGRKIDEYVSTLTVALGQSSTIYVGQCMGTGKYGRAYQGIRCVIAINFAVILLLAVPIYIFAEPISGLFTDDAGAISFAVTMVRTLMPLYILQAFHQVLSNSVRGFGHSSAALVTTVAGLIVCRQIYLAIATALVRDVRLVFLSWPVGWAFSAALAGVYYYFVIRRRNPAEQRGC